MISAPHTLDESSRLQALYDYDVLDTEAEQVFDDLTQLASEICDTPIALISLIDPDRQWFKSKVGIDASETSRDIAFCAHAIHQHDIFEIPDATKDERFHDNPLVTQAPDIRFYAGTPLISHSGHAIGTLCTIDRVPKQLSQHQRNALEILGRSVIAQLELRLKVKQLRQADQQKTDFLANISHELRTPLNAIIGFSNILSQKAESLNVAEKYKQYIRNIQISGDRLLKLVNSVLDITKIEEGKMEVENRVIHTREFFQSINDILMIKAKERGVKLKLFVDVNVPPNLYLDDYKLAQIMINLINNSIKFTEAGKFVCVEVNYNDQFHIKVIDQGIGISDADQQKLFNKFLQVGRNKCREGTGLGLSITKGLVDLLEGSIQVSSTLGQGTTFQVSFPVLPLPDESEPPVISDSKLQFTPSKRRILLVEDTVLNQEVAKAIFESMNCPLEVVGTGEDAIEVAKQHHYDLIMMDLQLPDLSGDEVADRIKHIQPKTPIIAFSANVFGNSAMELQERGYSGYLTKPIELNKLIQTLNAHLSYR
ncbi:ATP-binding protein [Litoribrevibacter albus]|uniref:histidine kinase n=1 Tax=Litoribrevibacter albus TaxID=1473156 RepID=A0AA37S6Z3_9GAMM|nr:ATP-binding protein [Litoribrevibacter albus]GLQ30216.1 hypothetical protein GCM10007876_06940 [Litoribrevibacter albus]